MTQHETHETHGKDDNIDIELRLIAFRCEIV